MAPAESKRLFFALWPGTGGAERLAHAAHLVHAACGGRVMRRETLHLTLVFLGNVPLAKLQASRAAAANVRGETHQLNFDRWGGWRRPGIVWAGCGATPPQLVALVQALQQGLREIGLAIEERTFSPHVTLLRNARAADLGALPPLDPIVWPVEDFVLVESQSAAGGAAYRIIDRWPLGNACPPVAG